MGSQKTGLMRGDGYGLLKAAELAAEMIRVFERGEAGVQQMRVEALDAPGWDDLVATRQGTTERWQIKRLLQPVSAVDISDVLITGEARPSSDLLHLAVANYVAVKSESKEVFGLAHLADLCDRARAPGIQAADFLRVERKSKALSFIQDVLPGRTPQQMLDFLRRFFVERAGLEPEISGRAETHLSHAFLNTAELVRAIHAWLLQWPNGAILIDPPLLYDEILTAHGTRDPARPLWLELTRETGRPVWSARGPLSVEKLPEAVWAVNAASAPVRIGIAASPFQNDLATSAVVRLLVHRDAPVTVTLEAEHEWRAHAARLCGGTLGATDDELDLKCGRHPQRAATAASKSLDADAFAKLLEEAMLDIFWRTMSEAVDKKLMSMPIEQNLRKDMRSHWASWYRYLSTSAQERQRFLSSMAATAEELRRPGFDRTVRVGQVLVDRFAKTAIFALAVASVFIAGGTIVDLAVAGTDVSMRFGAEVAHLIAIGAASFPGSDLPRSFIDATALGSVLREEAGVVLLGGLEASPIEIYNFALESGLPYHASESLPERYGSVGRPPIVISPGLEISKAIAQGSEALRLSLLNALTHMEADLLGSLLRATGEEV
jgi:hypothetical protein